MKDNFDAIFDLVSDGKPVTMERIRQAEATDKQLTRLHQFLKGRGYVQDRKSHSYVKEA